MARAKTETKAKAKKKSSGIWETARTLVYAVLAALIVRTVAFEPFNIPSGSMRPTLLVGDYLFVAKYSYGYSQYSLPWSVPLFSGRILDSAPERGDVAVFKLPRDNETDYIKRIIGLPGDRIQVLRGVLHINGEPVPREKVDSFKFKDERGRAQEYPQYRETLPNGVSYMTLDRTTSGGDNTQIYTVPEGHYFAMGDNRDNSQDSRFPQVGFIPEENLVGRAEFIFHSLANGTGIGEVWNWPDDTRGERVFMTID
jgi:signal peptidase I